MRALIAAAGNLFAAVRVRALLAEENVVCDATDTGRDSLLLGKLYDYDIILLVLALPNGDGYRLSDPPSSERGPAPMADGNNRVGSIVTLE